MGNRQDVEFPLQCVYIIMKSTKIIPRLYYILIRLMILTIKLWI